MVKPDPDDYSDPLLSTGHWSTATNQFQGAHNGQFDSSSYPTPTLKRSRLDRSVPRTPENETRIKCYRRWPSETETTDSVPVSDLPSGSTEFDGDNDTSKLKGVKYPGMGLFDSADEIQKRMRNQRKDDSVLKQMEVTSSGIEPNEFVWAGDGEFQRIRDIYASPSIEGSPVRDICSNTLSHSIKVGPCSNTTLSRTESLRNVKPLSRSVVAVPWRLQRRARYAHGRQPESLVRRHPGTGALSRLTTTTSRAPLTATTSFMIHRSLALVRGHTCVL